MKKNILNKSQAELLLTLFNKLKILSTRVRRGKKPSEITMALLQ
ncbi:hypothetical protein ACFL35_09170 [Candidatus Riflebacteria bacterium]